MSTSRFSLIRRRRTRSESSASPPESEPQRALRRRALTTTRERNRPSDRDPLSDSLLRDSALKLGTTAVSSTRDRRPALRQTASASPMDRPRRTAKGTRTMRGSVTIVESDTRDRELGLRGKTAHPLRDRRLNIAPTTQSPALRS